MPKSSPAGKIWSYNILGHLHQRHPIQRVLDVGAGLGTYSGYRRPGQHWTAVEIWGPYVQKYELEKKYDRVIISDIRYLDWQQLLPLDLVVYGDVLEHMSLKDALTVLERALTHARIVLISIPVEHSVQGAVQGNPFETHVETDLSHHQCMRTFPNVCLGIEEAGIGVYFLSRNEEDRRHLNDIFSDMLRMETPAVSGAAT